MLKHILYPLVVAVSTLTLGCGADCVECPTDDVAVTASMLPQCDAEGTCDPDPTEPDTGTTPPPQQQEWPGWYEFTNYSTSPAVSWTPFDCPEGNYMRTASEVIITNPLVRCLFEGPVVDVSWLPAGAAIRIEVTQYGTEFYPTYMETGSSAYTHLLPRFSNTTDLTWVSTVYLGVETYEARYYADFTVGYGTTVFRPLFGFDPARMQGGTASAQPNMHFSKVRIFHKI